MTLAQLQALAAVVELGSLTAAADRLSRSQSAISHALTELEDITQVKLLVRDRQPVVLTAAGERLWPYIRNVVREAQTLRQQFSLSRGKLEGRLVVASLPSVSLAFVVPALEALKAMHPGVSAVLLEGTDMEVEGWIEDGTADVGVVAGAKTFANNLPLLDEDFVAVAAAGTFDGRKSVSAKQLSALPFIFSKAGCGPVIADYFARGGAQLRAAFNVVEMRTILSMAEAGMGVSIVPRVTLTYTPFGGKVLELSPRLHRSVRLSWNTTGNAVTDEFVRLAATQRAKAAQATKTRAKKGKQ
ncbi:LysR family transcriptional regulator [Burkholderia ubonensis]|uniref:LysR family transcriptional regulator n=1 Tax=Burkholderia ubonensis TaxID=101571 RepID=A0A106PU86_9BURK|nr:LysR family transcriptional regulator [Burkholderia ubonensis]AJX14089.1 bacterial regulatory helix-turn-helix, lysR family protein [Burkholderia ubonensis MSMB22]KVC89170.1 LysR family transcriptional regulator [Burkholderia ubonensis]KVC94052.1 LysR family transcriptional regulator [Burkholderia ubonensis]KVD04361.1 LysR family transcriptional regulator [Burkholderia ubonensis]KVD14123.1 LysR family transcriptional regulator [Burkholderia ubonensis]